jgi:hypothetical protein
MAGENIPRRPTAKDAIMRVGLAAISNNVYTPPGDFDALPILGPLRDVEIDTPIDKVNQTAGGDSGQHEIFTRSGLWTVRIAAFLDEAAVNGDTRLESLNGMYVDFIIYKVTAWAICKGLGKIEFKMNLPAGQGETIVRDIMLTRWLGSALGDLVWANLETGTFT